MTSTLDTFLKRPVLAEPLPIAILADDPPMPGAIDTAPRYVQVVKPVALIESIRIEAQALRDLAASLGTNSPGKSDLTAAGLQSALGTPAYPSLIAQWDEFHLLTTQSAEALLYPIVLESSQHLQETGDFLSQLGGNLSANFLQAIQMQLATATTFRYEALSVQQSALKGTDPAEVSALLTLLGSTKLVQFGDDFRRSVQTLRPLLVTIRQALLVDQALSVVNWRKVRVNFLSGLEAKLAQTGLRALLMTLDQAENSIHGPLQPLLRELQAVHLAPGSPALAPLQRMLKPLYDMRKHYVAAAAAYSDKLTAHVGQRSDLVNQVQAHSETANWIASLDTVITVLDEIANLGSLNNTWMASVIAKSLPRIQARKQSPVVGVDGPGIPTFTGVPIVA